ncbi:hypothetical protein H0H81_007062 [Sphagnurus paluster]|uniref:Beta-lactamase-related domain-containing protein n=1 Tax=Sphagnurus paluster TaxID=117069 RepID=A0A9P7K4M8_9AGAR|nr:hypothetical protein H0H81_007062 [Sphagnurus paluster]
MHSQSLIIRWAISALFYITIAFPTSVWGQEDRTTAVLNSETDAFINEILSSWGSPGGVGVAVVRKNQQGNWAVETKGYGLATANGSRVTENTLFAIGSNSKLFTALATGLLINNKTLSPRLDWTSKMASVIPGWGLKDPFATKQASIIDLMSHRTGLPRHEFSYKWSDDIKRANFLRPSAEFRDTYQYSNIMYMILSHLPTSLLPSKIPFTRYVKEHIFEPLGLTSTTYSYDVAKQRHLAEGMARQGNDPLKDPFGGTPRAATWLQMLLLNGAKPGSGTQVISPDIIQKVSAGVNVVARQAVVSRLPFDGLGVAVLTNDQDYGNYMHNIIKFRLIDEALGLEKIDWNARIKALVQYNIPDLATPRPAKATLPSVGFTSLAGTYSNPGYGEFELCYVSEKYPAQTPSCQSLASNVSTILPGAVSPGIPTFIAHWDAPWTGYIRLQHFNGNLFNISSLRSYPTNNASEPFWASGIQNTFDTDSLAEAVASDGGVSFALSGIWGADYNLGRESRDDAEVWFDKR